MKLTTIISFFVAIGLSIVSANNVALRIRQNKITKEEAAAACSSAEEWDREDCIFDVLAVNDLDMAENYFREGLGYTLNRDETAGDDTYDVDGLLSILYGDDDDTNTTSARNDDDTSGNPL